MDRCEVCSREIVRHGAIPQGDLCECAIYRTPGCLSGAWRLANSRIFARTLMSLWVEHGQDKSATVVLFLHLYPELTSEQVHRAIDWLTTHHRRVALEALQAKLDGIDEALMMAARYCQRFAIERPVFEAEMAKAARSAWRGVNLGELATLESAGGPTE